MRKNAMNTLELLYEAKRRTGVSSDYALAQKLEIPRQRITDYKNGTRQPDTYTLTRLAIILEREPMGLIAEFEAATEKNPVRREFWKGFLSRQNLKGIAIAVLALNCGVFYDQGAMADTSRDENAYNQKLLHKATLCEIHKIILRLTFAPLRALCRMVFEAFCEHLKISNLRQTLRVTGT